MIVTADDLGLSPGVSAGILEAHRRGVVRSASLLVTFPSGEEGAALARQEPALEIGLHLDLVGGRPVSDPARVRTLVDGEGRFHGLGGLLARAATGRVRADEIAREMRAQVERARAWGTPALAWDSHRHAHALPQLARVVGAVARELGARWIRRPVPVAAWRGPKPLALAVSTLVASPFLRGVGGNDRFADLTSWRPDADAVIALSRRDGVIELCAHPGYVDDELRRHDTLGTERSVDLALLCDARVVAALDREVTWRVPSA